MASLQVELLAVRAELATVRAENAELRARLGKTSQNSSKPPSSDPPGARPRPKQKDKKRRARKRGAQPGHKANNAAERRFAVLWRKGSFGSDSLAGRQFGERFLTVRATLRTQNRDLYAFLRDACTSALHGTAAPSLLPESVRMVDGLQAAA